MGKFTRRDFEELLRRIDAELSAPCTVVVIGGAALCLKFNRTHVTGDLDLWSVSANEFWGAVERANATLAVPVPVQKAAIAEPPYSFEERLAPLKVSGLTKLKVLVPEAHDFVLLKVGRGETHDLDAIEGIHQNSPLDVETLVARYLETRPQVMGSVEMHRLNFLAALARLYDAATVAEVDRRTATQT